MEEITDHSVATFSVLFIIIIALMFIIGYYLVYWGKMQLAKDRVNEKDYEDAYKLIQKHIKDYPVDLGMYYKIKREIWKLENMKWENREKTAMLHIELCSSKFMPIAMAIAEKKSNV